MVLKIPVDAAGMQRAADEHGDLMRSIAQRGKEAGAAHHNFFEGDDGQVIVVDEWDSPDNFKAFFEAEGENIGQLMQTAGAQGEPDPPRFYRALSLGDEF
ncbi:MAG: hypothetical protein QOJ29_1547 [Thermoleophilaceae bacterium]|jgi:hypothetical protein|nr:hypothetical protein [Thermoleophilaceae bacterium]